MSQLWNIVLFKENYDIDKILIENDPLKKFKYLMV